MNSNKKNRRNFLKSSALIGSASLLCGRVHAAEIGENGSDLWQAFSQRRSVRSYSSDEVPDADILKILDAARSAPTSGNQQPWKFLVVRDEVKIKQMQLWKNSTNQNPPTRRKPNLKTSPANV